MATEQPRRSTSRRELRRDIERRRAEAARRRRTTLLASAAAALVLVAAIVIVVVVTSGNSSTPSAAGSSPVASPSGTTATTKACVWTKSGTAARPVTVPPTTTPPHTGTTTVQVTTTRGAMTFTLDRANAPCAVESFVSLAQQKYFDNTPCPRVVSSGIYILQCGDPTGTTSGGPGYTFADELTGKEQYSAGVLAMANSGPDTNGSQFFVVYQASQLGANYTIFGHVTSGLDVVTKVAAGGDDGSNQAGGGKPKLPISLTKLTVS